MILYQIPYIACARPGRFIPMCLSSVKLFEAFPFSSLRMHFFLILFLHFSALVISQGIPMADSKKLDTDTVHQRCTALAVANGPNRWLPESGSDTSYTSSREGTPDTVDTVIIGPQTRPGSPDTVEFPSPPPGTPTLRSPRRRNQEQRKPALSGMCGGRYTSISLDSCLGWNPANGGSFVAQRQYV